MTHQIVCNDTFSSSFLCSCIFLRFAFFWLKLKYLQFSFPMHIDPMPSLGKQNPRVSTKDDHPGKPQWRMLFYNEMSCLDEPNQFLMHIRESPMILTDKKWYDKIHLTDKVTSHHDFIGDINHHPQVVIIPKTCNWNTWHLGNALKGAWNVQIYGLNGVNPPAASPTLRFPRWQTWQRPGVEYGLWKIRGPEPQRPRLQWGWIFSVVFPGIFVTQIFPSEFRTTNKKKAAWPIFFLADMLIEHFWKRTGSCDGLSWWLGGLCWCRKTTVRWTAGWFSLPCWRWWCRSSLRGPSLGKPPPISRHAGKKFCLQKGRIWI